MKRINLTHVTKVLFIAAFLLTSWGLHAQERGPLHPRKTKMEQVKPTIADPFTLSSEKRSNENIVKKATYLSLDAGKLKSALKAQPRELLFYIPQKDGSKLTLSLERQEILTPDFKVTNEKGVEMPYEPGAFFTGRVLDRGRESTATLGIAGGEIMAMMTLAGDNYVLGTLPGGGDRNTQDYVFYNDKNLQLPNTYQCGTSVEEYLLDNPSTTTGTAAMPAGKNIVRVFFEADYRTYLDKGSSVSKVADYVTGLFNMVATIYHNENIVTQISEIKVWTTADPYPITATNTSGDVLKAFRATKNGGFNGDIAHLISTKPVGDGGIAYIDVLCFPTVGYRTAYSNTGTTFTNFPLYSWTVDVVTHEMGHNLGSPHTHDCAWGASGNQTLDNCAAPSGGCTPGPAPVNGGTIMSYCHLTAAGKNFNLGFGSQPGARIRSKVAAATCLNKAFLDCAGATPINCGDVVTGTTVGGVNNVSYYSCNSWYQSGPEKVYILQTTEPGTITASLSGLSADLDVIILDACSESDCLAEGNNTAVVPDAPAGMYFIVVDGYYGAQGAFTLSINCSGFCFSTGLTNYEFIDEVAIGSIDNQSGNNYGYAVFATEKTDVQRGGTAEVSLTPGFINGTYNERWRIWVDANQDGDFNDTGELVFSSSPASTTTVTGTMSIPATALLGETRMRVAMRYSALPEDCGTFYGEVEDYTVNIVPYCPSAGNTTYEFIDKITVGTFGNASGNNNGYADFTTPGPIEMLNGDTVPIELTPGFTGSAYGERFKVWIDFDQDFKFDETEVVFQSVTSSNTTQTGKFIVPAGALPGETRMRISMIFGGIPNACSYSFWGETEDYTVSITPFCPSSGKSAYEFIQTVGIGDLTNDSGDDGGYANFTDLPLTATIYDPVAVVLVPGFAGSTYDEFWRIWVDFNKNKVFETEEQVFDGGPASGMVFGAFLLPGELASGDYGLRISMRYGGFPAPCGNIGWGEVEDYTLTVLNEGGLAPGVAGRSAGTNNSSGFEPSGGDIVLFPNPAKDVLYIDWQSVKPVAGKVVSLTGQTLFRFDGNNVPDKLDIYNLPAGMYMLHVVTAENQSVIKRFVKAG